MSTVYLRVKVKSLAAEARIIRTEEHRAKASWKRLRERARGSDDPALTTGAARASSLFFALKGHRKHEVRQAARSSLLAYGFLRGRPYLAIERTCHVAPQWVEITRMVRRYGSDKADDTEIADRLMRWSEAA